MRAATGFEAIVLFGFGGPTAPEDIRAFINRVVGGRRIPEERFQSVVDHYMQIGGKSPYDERTQQMAAALSATLQDRGIRTPVKIAYLNAAPFVGEVIERLAKEHVRAALGIVLAPHQGAAGRDKYIKVSDEACRQTCDAPHFEYIDPYFENESFIGAHADRVNVARARFGQADFSGIELIFTAHSIPVTLPGTNLYVQQIKRSAELIAATVGAQRWTIAYQSRAGSPADAWLEPDIRDVLDGLPVAGIRSAIVAPIGFLCDHVEVLYDLDIDAKNVAHAAGVRFERAGTLNDHPLFVQMLADLTVASMQRRAVVAQA